ncbi:MAG TPA: alpha-1,2-fucosyltransferase [Elusimicrobia bacterium]|nr:alpha-1,2-fucosyltransferase [Elusimicrobiota bacterium]
MIIVKLVGGLGNQMFQYALGRRLSVKNNLPLKFDISYLGKANRPFTYRLEHLNTAGTVATAGEIARLKCGSGLKAVIAGLLGYPRYSDRYVKENGLRFQESVLNLKGGAYLDGYWGNEKYFTDIRDILLAEFTVKAALDGENKRIAELIAATNSVSLHVRRGDYVSDPGAARVLGTCPLDYYSKAVELICAKAPDPHFFVFSDDQAWVKDNIKIALHQVTYVDHNDGEHEFEDLRLMTLCRHNIIANSSFSWWGAWLNKKNHKTVLAPAKWFVDPTINASDFIPPSWTKI